MKDTARIPAIETRYKGYRMRSRLEARWAVVFDAMGLKWTYEPQGFLLSTGPYLPDFYFEDWGVYVEIKPRGFLCQAADIAKAFNEQVGAILLICGSPGTSQDYQSWLLCYHSGRRPHVLPLQGFCMFEEGKAQLECDGMDVDTYYTFSDGARILDDILFFPHEPDRELIDEAMNAGRSARFEHGEHGDVR